MTDDRRTITLRNDDDGSPLYFTVFDGRSDEQALVDAGLYAARMGHPTVTFIGIGPQPATGGIIARGLTVVGEGPVCDGLFPPRRWEWRGEHGPELVDLPRREPGAARAAVTLDHPAPDTPTLAAIVQALAAQAKQQPEPDETEPDAAGSDPNTGLVVGEYRTDRGHKAWVFRCWGDDASGCDGYLALDKPSEAAAIRARDRHVAENHTAPATPSDQEK